LTWTDEDVIRIQRPLSSDASVGFYRHRTGSHYPEVKGLSEANGWISAVR
jgi:hypothetical protein